MTRILLLLLALLLPAACGVDGAPTPPSPAAQTGISITGQVQVGVVSG